MSIPTNRMVAVLTPLVFAPLAGSIAVVAAKYFPGVKIDQGSLTAIFVAGATIAFGKAAIWMKGWQSWEQKQPEGEVVPVAVDEVADLEPDAADVDDTGADEDFVEEDDIEDAVAEEAPVPVAA
jgi:hypothetical protein